MEDQPLLLGEESESKGLFKVSAIVVVDCADRTIWYQCQSRPWGLFQEVLLEMQIPGNLSMLFEGMADDTLFLDMSFTKTQQSVGVTVRNRYPTQRAVLEALRAPLNTNNQLL